MWPGTGAIVAALEYATQRTARIAGKPDTLMFTVALDRLGDGRALMVGDRLDSDLLGAAAVGIDCAIVLTGVTGREQAEAAYDPAPVAIAEDLHSLVVSVSLALIVNPSAGGGRAGRYLPEVQQRLTALGLAHHAEFTRSLDHARALAKEAVAARETAVAFGGDGLVGAVAGALSGSDGVLGVLPGGRGNDFVRTLGIPPTPVAACDVLHTGTVRKLDLGEVNALPYMGIASCGFDSDGQPDRERDPDRARTLVYAYGLIRALVTWKPATFTIELDGGEPRVVTGYSVAAANSKFFGAGMMLAPDASLARRSARDRDDRRRVAAAVSDARAACAARHPCAAAQRRGRPRLAGQDQRLAAVHDVRRWRPDRRFAGDRAGAPRRGQRDRPSGAVTSALDAKILAARAVGELARRAGRGGGTSLPGKVLTRLEPHAIERLAGRLHDGTAVISATNGKTTTAAMAASVLRRSGLALVAQPGRGEHGGRHRLDAPGRGPARGRDRRRAWPVRDRRVLAGSHQPAAASPGDAARQPVP